jgi:phage baseplate assembly protein W
MTAAAIYSDLPINFDVHPIKGDLVLTTDENAVKRSVRNLLLTDPYERFFNPDVGAGIRQSLFENMSKDTAYVLQEKITETITNYEPRANLYSVNVKALPDENSYYATIVFGINSTTSPITLDLVLKRVR